MYDKINYKSNIIDKNSIIELFKTRDKDSIKQIAKINECQFKTFDVIKEFIIDLLFIKKRKK